MRVHFYYLIFTTLLLFTSFTTLMLKASKKCKEPNIAVDSTSLKSGDLIFQVSKGARDSSTFSEAIASSTFTCTTDLPFTHVGVIIQDSNGLSVIHASSSRGVVIDKLTDFLKDSESNDEGEPLVRLYSLDKKKLNLIPSILKNLYTHLGKPYDNVFAFSKDAIYCSELIYISFMDKKGEPLFKASPMSFKNSENITVPYWIDYFKKYKAQIPEGELGTNPYDMSKSKVLTLIKTL